MFFIPGIKSSHVNSHSLRLLLNIMTLYSLNNIWRKPRETIIWWRGVACRDNTDTYKCRDNIWHRTHSPYTHGTCSGWWVFRGFLSGAYTHGTCSGWWVFRGFLSDACRRLDPPSTFWDIHRAWTRYTECIRGMRAKVPPTSLINTDRKSGKGTSVSDAHMSVMHRVDRPWMTGMTKYNYNHW